MALRDSLGGNPALAVVAVIVIIAAIALGFRGSGAGEFAEGFYYDVDANELFTADYAQQPPIPAPSGGQGVRAHVFSCSDCADPASYFIARLEKYSDEGKRLLAQIDTADAEQRMQLNARIAREIFVALPPEGDADIAWHTMESPGGMAVMQHLTQQCATGGKAINCTPR